MKRVKIYIFLVISLHAFILSYCGVQLFSEKEFIIPYSPFPFEKTQLKNSDWKIEFTINEKEHVYYITNKEFERFKKTGHFKYNLSNSHGELVFLWLLFIGFFICLDTHRICTLDELYFKHEDIGERFYACSCRSPITLTRVKIYNAIDSINFDPVKRSFLAFWGY